MLKARRIWLAAVAAGFTLILAGCGGGGGGGEAPAPATLPAQHVAGVYEKNFEAPVGQPYIATASLRIDATGYVIGRLAFARSVNTSTTTVVTFAGTANVWSDGSWTLPNTNLRSETTDYTSEGYPVTVSHVNATVTGTFTPGTVSFVVPVAPPGYPSTVAIPVRPYGTTPLLPGGIVGLYMGSDIEFEGAGLPVSTGLGFAIDAAGQVAGHYGTQCRISGTAAVHAPPSTVMTANLTFTGTRCPGAPGATHRFLGEIWSGQKDQLSLHGLIDGKTHTITALRITEPGAALPDGSFSPLPGFNDAAVPAIAALPADWYFQDEAQGLRTSLLLEASGRFVLTVSQGVPWEGPYAEDVIFGTMSVSGNQWTATAAQHLHRATDGSYSPQATVNLSGQQSTSSETGRPLVALTLSGTAAPLLATQVTVQESDYYPYLEPIVPHGGGFLNYGLRIDANTGRVSGTLRAGCTIEGVLALPDPSRNSYRLRATLSGTGCLAAGLAEGTGEYLGSYSPGGYRVPPTLNFVGLVAGRIVRFSLI